MKVKNLRPGILIIPDAGLKLLPGQMADLDQVSKQVARALEQGALTDIDRKPRGSDTEPHEQKDSAPAGELEKPSPPPAKRKKAKADNAKLEDKLRELDGADS